MSEAMRFGVNRRDSRFPESESESHWSFRKKAEHMASESRLSSSDEGRIRSG
jgi:hypothetical protein